MAEPFGGFVEPQENWSKLPHVLVDALPLVETVAEAKVVLYVLRHTWGYQEFEGLKRMTLDELAQGRRRRDGSRMDGGTGLSRNAVKDGVRRAVAHGFLVQLAEQRDPGRRAYLYALNMLGGQSLTPWGSKSDPHPVEGCPPGGQSLTPWESKCDPRSEKDIEKDTERDTGERAAWPLIEQQLRYCLFPETFAANFEQARARVDGDVVRVGLQTERQVAYVQDRLMRELQGAVDRALGDGFEVLVGVQGEAG